MPSHLDVRETTPAPVGHSLYLAPFLLSIAGDVSVLAFYAVGRSAGLPFLRHPLHSAMTMLFTFNMVGSAFFWAHYWVDPGTAGCSVTVFGVVAGYAGDYFSSATVAWLLFRSLVLNMTPLSTTRAVMSLLWPVLLAVAAGASTLGADTTQPPHVVCWLTNPNDAHGLAVASALVLAVALNGILSALVVYNLTKRASVVVRTEIHLGAAGTLSGVGRSPREDSEVLTKRLLVYPAVIIICGGSSLVASIASNPWAGVVGDFMLMLNGLFNTAAFFFLDPTSAKTARGLLETLDAADTRDAEFKAAGVAVAAAAAAAGAGGQWGAGSSARRDVGFKRPWGVSVAGKIRPVLRIIAGQV
ncbi:hypothetical protein M427DRAFT_52321 [Gonapodya prolifera JEL478]|uniref:G-protein coupled receptors family 2 profile 2 domain-containing protein n=1 Tax=Gonapodya prolifera (strain JEL478) TaxID=1344416 RepID=A0A139ATJ9_GONPJ|nr:hypothetical protein M427DRAFT_52321 [Gonapodya prolifera JEL478]|eukprot:KXS20056.1 hypothetical protein M427DRAFT_52321 [Gonapodya prolifera JEL478]